jgi:membrane-bound inhibitor of C-type lysozyme
MHDYDPTSPHDTVPARPVSSATSGPPVAGSPGGAGAALPPPPASSPDSSASVTMAEQLRLPEVRRLRSNRRSRRIMAAALMSAVIGLAAACGPSSATATSLSPTAAGSGSAGGLGSGGAGSNARSGPAAGGAAGTVGSVTTSSFTMSTSTGQKVTIDEASSTTYQTGTSSTSASAITKGETVLVLGTTNGTTITATQVIVQSTGNYGSAASSAARVIPFQSGAQSTSKLVGQIPANYSQGSGTIVSGTIANNATEAALAAYPGGLVDRVVQLSNGEYEVHYIGVNWPHHVFVNQDFKVVGAN